MLTSSALASPMSSFIVSWVTLRASTPLKPSSPLSSSEIYRTSTFFRSGSFLPSCAKSILKHHRTHVHQVALIPGRSDNLLTESAVVSEPAAADDKDTAALLAKLRAEIEELKNRETAALKAKDDLDTDLQIAQADAADAKSQVDILQKQLADAKTQHEQELAVALRKAEEVRVFFSLHLCLCELILQ